MFRPSSMLFFSFWVLFSCASFSQVSQPAQQNTKNEQKNQQIQLRQLSQLVEYIGVDYAAAVNNDGKINNADEYQEMIEFSALIITKISALKKLNEPLLLIQAQHLQQAVQQKALLLNVRQLAATLRNSLLTLMPAILLPRRLISTADTHALFQIHCASCHGTSGKGDGILAKQLNPQPTNFTNKERAQNRSLLGLFDAITNGLDDTAMPAFTQLKAQQRWSLAFYVGSLAFKGSKNSIKASHLPNITDWVRYNPKQLAHTDQQSSQLTLKQVASLRSQPLSLFDQPKSPIAIAKSQLQQALMEYKEHNFSLASTLAISAYLDGFELVENSLDAYDDVLRKNIEVNLITLRQFITHADQEEQLFDIAHKVLIQLDQAEQLLSGESLSNTALFSASLIILLREGLEALLVIIALMTVLVRTQRKDALKFVHFGWLAALVAGVATWAAAQSLINISGASREVMEGVAAMVAAIMLLYVGIWMHSKSNTQQWQAYIQKHINSQLQTGTLWGLAALSFIAVYREVFETVLFYQSLLTQASPTQFSVVLSGFIIGCALLALVAWGLLKYSIKLPIARFFSTTTYLLLALAFILMGKSISALQEAAIVTISPLPVDIDMSWVGVGSTWQGLLAQCAIIGFFVAYFYRNKLKQQAKSIT